MPTPFIMPKMDMDQESVTINEWLKKEGDPVKKGEPLVVIETDKITSEVEAPATGRLAGIIYRENVDVPVSEVVAYILGEDETESDLPERTEPETDTRVNQEDKDKVEKSTLKTEKTATAVAQRMAEAEGINLQDIPASGEKITKEDVEKYLGGLEGVETRVQTPATPAARRIAYEKSLDLTQVEGSGPRGRVQAADVQSVSQQTPGLGETLALSNMRKRIAERLTTSYQTTPHIYLTAEVDMREAEASRKRMNELANQDSTPAISMTAFITRIVAWSLKRHPYLNASFQNNEIRFWEEINIGIATALDDGLIVPVIRNADQMTAKEINNTLRDLTRRARSGDLSLDEIQNGTFTISNLGMYGIQSFTAIINPPQSAILAVGTLTRRPVVVDDADTLEIRPMMMLTLGADHRIVDGAVAAEFLADIVKALETPELLLF